MEGVVDSVVGVVVDSVVAVVVDSVVAVAPADEDGLTSLAVDVVVNVIEASLAAVVKSGGVLVTVIDLVSAISANDLVVVAAVVVVVSIVVGTVVVDARRASTSTEIRWSNKTFSWKSNDLGEKT